MILSSFVAEGVCTCAPGGAPVCMIRLACWRCCCTPVLGRVGWHVGAEGSGSSRAAAGRVGQSAARAGTWPTSSATGSLSTGPGPGAAHAGRLPPPGCAGGAGAALQPVFCRPGASHATCATVR